MSQTNGGVNEDSVSFVSAVFGALGSTVNQQNSPQTLLLGLVLSAVAKALPSLGKKQEDWKEDVALLLFTFLGALGGGIQSKYTYSDSTSQMIVILGLFAGLVGKVGLSLYDQRNASDWWHQTQEDWLPLVAIIVWFLGGLPLGLWSPHYAAIGVFLGFLAKQLTPSGTGS
jgi:uncharacterized membrane protein YfcA